MIKLWFKTGSEKTSVRAWITAFAEIQPITLSWIEPRPAYRDSEFVHCGQVFFTGPPVNLPDATELDEAWLFTESGGVHVLAQQDTTRFVRFDESEDSMTDGEERTLHATDTTVFIRATLRDKNPTPYTMRQYCSDDRKLLVWRLLQRIDKTGSGDQDEDSKKAVSDEQ